MTNPPTPHPPIPRFDWYAATVPAGPHDLIAGLCEGFSGEPRETRGMHGYRQGFDVVANGVTAARVLVGGKNGHPHAWASGEEAVRFAEIVRGNWPTHKVSRMDTAADFDGPGAWDRLTALALSLADELGLTVNYAGDWHRAEGGRTLYIGSRKSAVFVRIYEKGIQLGAPLSRDWVRVEVQVRPDGDARERAATSSATEAWGYAKWTKRLATELLEVDVDRVAISIRRPADDERALEAMVAQYWRPLERLAQANGGWAGAGVALGELLMRIARG